MNKLSIFLLAVFMTGCASVSRLDPARDAAAKKFTAPQDASLLYIYRNERMGAAVSMDVQVDGKPIGVTGSRTYLVKQISPGPHTVSSKAENTDTLEINAVAGKIQYVWQEVKMGVMMARTKLHLVDEATGQQGVRESELVQTLDE